MEQFLEFFQFSTAIPFGYMLFYGACGVAALVALILMLTAALQRKIISLRFIGGGAVLTLVAIIFVANFVSASTLDMNPSFQESDIVGHWQDGDSFVVFEASHTVHFHFGKGYEGREPLMSGDGTWARKDDFEIEIVTPNATHPAPPMRLIESNGELRIIVEDFDDPDMWDHHLGFKRRHEK